MPLSDNPILSENISREIFLNPLEYINDPKNLESLTNCYLTIFNNPPWNENWTKKSAEKLIISSLTPSAERQPLLSLIREKDQVVGFVWIIMAETKALDISDMPYGFGKARKKNALDLVLYWLNWAHHKKLIIFREVGILQPYRFINNTHIGSLLTYPLIKEALRHGYKVLMLWTKINSPINSYGMKFGWHPIAIFPENDIVIIKGSVKNFINCLEGILLSNEKIKTKMNEMKNLYLCK